MNQEIIEYSNKVRETLPLLLSSEMHGKSAITISSYMNGIIRKCTSIEDMKVFAQLLNEVQKFSKENNLQGLSQTCLKWNNKAVEKVKEIKGITKSDKIQKSNLETYRKMQDYLKQTWSAITTDPDSLEIVSHKLDRIETSLKSTGSNYLTQDDMDMFTKEILAQKEEIRTRMMMIDDILETGHMARR